MKRKKMEEQKTDEILDYLKRFEIMIQNIDCKVSKFDQIKYNNQDETLIKSKVKAAVVTDGSAQDITSMLREGRIINYGKGKGDYRFKKSELLDLREIRVAKD